MNKKHRFEWNAAGALGLTLLCVGLLITLILLCIRENFTVTKMQTAIWTLLLSFVGIGLALFGSVLFLRLVLRNLRISRVIKKGKVIMAEVALLTRDACVVTFRGRNPFYAVLNYTDEFGVSHEFQSSAIYKDRSAELTGKEIPVYVMPDDYSDYYVDLNSVLIEAEPVQES